MFSDAVVVNSKNLELNALISKLNDGMDLSESEQQVYDQQANAIKNNVIYHVFIK